MEGSHLVPEKGNLGPSYIRPFRFIAREGKVAYHLYLPEELSQIHNTFHLSQLRKWIVDESSIVPLEDIHVDGHLNYMEKLMVILDKKAKTFKQQDDQSGEGAVATPKRI